MRKPKNTRDIPDGDKCELWGRSAGRCQFQGCNRAVFVSDVTQERVNISQKAHIFSFSEEGPRGRGPFITNSSGLNRVGNLMLLCYACHKKIDKHRDGGRYGAALLKSWKEAHERRVALVTSISPNKRSHVVLYGANIGDGKVDLDCADASEALFPDWYPAREEPIRLGMNWEGRDENPEYWQVEEKNLRMTFAHEVRPRVTDGGHFSVFGFAPMPLLIRLGTLITDRVPVEVYQRHREPVPSWRWSATGLPAKFHLVAPRKRKGRPVLLLSLSARISNARAREVLGQHAAVWEIAVERPNNDMMKTRQHLAEFRTIARHALERIAEAHGVRTPLAILPAMPVSAAIEFGRIRMPKVSMPWQIFDHNQKTGRFTKALEIGGG